MHRLSIFIMALAIAGAAAAETVEVTPAQDIRPIINSLQPGDELVLRGGTYNFSSRFNVTVIGEAANPVTVRGADGEVATISMNTSNQNIMEVQGSRYLTLRNLRFTGGSHGIRLMDSDFITIEDNEIFETGDVAISANSGGTYEGLLIRRNHIHHTNGTGEGMYLGCNYDSCRVLNSIIEYNYIHHTNRPSVEQGDGIELKEGSAGNIVRHNVIHDTNYPGILTYSASGNGPANVIEGNLIWNSYDYGIQSAADSVIRNNIILGASIAMRAHQNGAPSNQIVAHNTIIDGGIEVRNVSGPVVIANNAVYSSGGAAISLISGDLGQVTVAGNVGTGGLSGGSSGWTAGNGLGADFVDAHQNGAPPIDVFPSSGSALIGAGSAAHAADSDFNGAPRSASTDAGAYRYSAGGNPGWTLQAGFKSGAPAAAKPNPPTDLTAE